MKPFISVKDAFELSQKAQNVLFIDTRHNIYDLEQGKKAYEENHIPGAIFLDLHDELAGQRSDKTGRHPLPSIDSFRNVLARNGITKNLHVICYDDVSGGYTARLWFMLYSLGYDNVQILEGGITKWIEENHPVTSEKTFSIHKFADIDIPDDWSKGRIKIVNFDQVNELVSQGFTGLIDARDSDRFRGEDTGPDPVGGHIPGASNRWWKANIADSGLLRDRKELKNEFDLLLTTTKPEDAVLYCGSGVTACFNLAIMKELNYPEAKVYIGSFSDWIKHSENVEI